MASANDAALSNFSAAGVGNEELAIKNDLVNLMEGSSQTTMAQPDDLQVQDMDLDHDEADSGYAANNEDEKEAIDG
jgi:hypothetical protein